MTRSKRAITKPVAAETLLSPVFEHPADDELRRVIADALLEQQHPHGELITIQLRIAEKRAKPGDHKRSKELAKKHFELLIGDIFKVAHKETCVFEKGFLVEVSPERRLVQRPDWIAAAGSAYWATVRTTNISVLTTPHWWISEWANNPATRRSMRTICFSGARLERATTVDPWRIVEANARSVYSNMLIAFLKTLSRGEQATVRFSDKLPAKHRAFHVEALTKAGINIGS